MDNEHIKRWFKHIVNRKIQSKIEMRYYFISNVWAKILKSLNIVGWPRGTRIHCGGL